MKISTTYNRNWEPYLTDWWQNTYLKRVIKLRRKYWFVKCVPNDERAYLREQMAYKLGRGWTNIAEVRALTSEEFSTIKNLDVELPTEAKQENTYLVRLCFDYNRLFLPIRSLDYAIATELVFSLWTRRRDAHSFNRVYINGIPIFFDHLTGLLGEQELIDLDKFFSYGPDAGNAGWWKLQQIAPSSKPETLFLRQEEKKIFAGDPTNFQVSLPVYNKNGFGSLLTKAAIKINLFSAKTVFQTAVSTGFDKHNSELITEFLEKTKQDIPLSLEKLRGMFHL